MFNCNSCGKTSHAGEPAIKRVVETRTKTYRNAVKVKEVESEDGEEQPKRPVRRRDARPQYIETRGTEIVREITICHSCAGEEYKPQPVAESTNSWWTPGSIPGIQLG